jgi:alkylation response protein AidB-like acyl-CoA dehydrogenase
MTTAQTSLEVPTLQELLLRIEEIKPILAANADQTEADRRIAQPNVDALTEAGAFKVTVPRRFGGYEMTIREKLEVSAAVAEACGSTGWVVALTNVCNWTGWPRSCPSRASRASSAPPRTREWPECSTRRRTCARWTAAVR